MMENKIAEILDKYDQVLGAIQVFIKRIKFAFGFYDQNINDCFVNVSASNQEAMFEGDIDKQFYIGSIDDLLNLVDKGIDNFYSTATVANVGYDSSKRKWWGWSHRAIKSYKEGDLVLVGDIGAAHLPHERFTNLLNHDDPGLYLYEDECKTMAYIFAKEVS